MEKSSYPFTLLHKSSFNLRCLCPTTGKQAAPHMQDELKAPANGTFHVLSLTGDLKFDKSKADGVYKKTASNAKLRKYLPDFKFTPFDQGEKPNL